MPYIYSLGWKVTKENYTIMRGLAFDFANDKNVYGIVDQFMFGPAMLVNPVTVPMYYPWVQINSGSIIPSSNLLSQDGKHGLTGEYYNGMEFNSLVKTQTDSIINFRFGMDAPMKGMTSDTFSVRWSGKIIAPETGEYSINTMTDDGARIWVDNKQIINDWTDHAAKLNTGKINLEASKSYDFRFEYFDYLMGASAQLYWVLPSQKKVEKGNLAEKTRKVYLPGSAGWIDFWTGKKFTGGQTITAPAPIDIIPLFVKEGSIIPMGPFLQYSSEKPEDPIELRIYPGADGNFELYEDENDNYNYEKGRYALIPFSWNDKSKTLTVGDRKGEFNGMLKKRTFNVVLVNQTNGTGLDISKSSTSVPYDGKHTSIKIK